MTFEGYRLQILLVVVDWIKEESENTGMQYKFMNDNTLDHKAPPAGEYLSAHRTEPLPLPAYSQELNPLNNVWALIKFYIHEQYPEFE